MQHLQSAFGALVLFFAAFALADVLVRWLGGGILATFEAGRGLIAIAAPGAAILIVIYTVLVRWGGWSLARLGLRRQELARGLARGAVWGLALSGLTLGLTMLGGARLLTGPGFAGERYLPVASAVLAGLALSAMVEELLFRGYPLVRLAGLMGPMAASLVLTVGFVALHLPNPDVTLLGLVNIGLAGLVLSGVFLTGGGLPAAWALHLAWNGGLALGADAPVSGLRFGMPVIEYVPGAHGWWDGGPFGPEGGMAATLVLGAAAVWWFWRLRGAGLPDEGDTA